MACILLNILQFIENLGISWKQNLLQKIGYNFAQFRSNFFHDLQMI